MIVPLKLVNISRKFLLLNIPKNIIWCACNPSRIGNELLYIDEILVSIIGVYIGLKHQTNLVWTIVNI
jgi:hypothetical protein